MNRRDFLRNTGWFVVGASMVGSPACTDDDELPDGESEFPLGTYGFPQGVASGDPRASSVVLWTRAVLLGSSTGGGDINLRVEVSTDPGFATRVVDTRVTAALASDHTVRVLVTGLAAATNYYYRFRASRDEIVGRTRTAPAANADVQVNLAWVSCQDYGSGHYGAYRQMLADDDARPDADKIHAVVHLGDMIYETRADGFQGAIDDDFNEIMLKNRDGSDRAVPPFPSGGGTRSDGNRMVNFAATVDDYRHLYKTFLSDPDLQAARARWPFVSIWDDHEFTDDCWQSQANFSSTLGSDEADQARRVAASQAWFEYVPVQLTGAGSVTGVANPARDFTPVAVKNAEFTAPNADNFVAEPNNVAAIGAITIYRSLRFGKHVELVMTDQRSYRSDHAIPEELTENPLFFAPRNALPMSIVKIMDQGSTARLSPNDTMAPTSIPITAEFSLPNPRAGSPIGTMLGKAQKAWWKATMKGSDATWKLWGSELMLMRLRITKTGFEQQLFDDRIMSGDAWDGYPTERKELMSYLRTEGIKNVVVLTGDIHASFAGTVAVDADALPQEPVACELVASGISSNSLFSFFKFATGTSDLAPLISLDATSKGFSKNTENLNMLLLHGIQSAGAFTQPGVPLSTAIGLRDPDANPHLKYVDTNAQGYGYAKINGTEVAASIITINRPLSVPPAAGPGIKRTASFTIPKDNPGGMTGPVFTGTKPFPEQ